jgi:hypothetical protein
VPARGAESSPGRGTLPPGRSHPPDLVLVQQSPHGGGRGAKLAPHLLQGPRVGDQPVLQIGPDALEAQLGDADGDALLGGVLALTGQLLAAGWQLDAIVGDGAADAGWVVARWLASWGTLQPSSSSACRQARRVAKPSRLACKSS